MMTRPTATPMLALVSCLACSAASASDPAEVALARSVLERANVDSIADDREYCGTIGVGRDGQLLVSRVHRGWRTMCRPRRPYGAVRILASFHTHGAFALDADSELPSPRDVYTDMDARTNGYLATPGGRFWFIDGTNGTVFQICGPGCLPSDPDYLSDVFGTVMTFYTLDQLRARQDRF